MTDRIIKFRGKHIHVFSTNQHFDGHWVCGYLANKDYINTGEAERLVDYNTVGQFTGLFDKCGNEIYEGDIFKFADEVWSSCETSCGTEYDSADIENYGVVGYCEDSGRFDFVKYKYNENTIEANLHENHDMEFAEFVSELEIVGNIHDNPELLEVEI